MSQLSLNLISAPSLYVFTQKGKLHNPTGEGVRAVSSTVQSRAAKVAEKKWKSDEPNSNHPDSHGSRPGPHRHHHQHTEGEHETTVKEAGSVRRNITRKKTDPAAAGTFDSKNKKQGGAGYVLNACCAATIRPVFLCSTEL